MTSGKLIVITGPSGVGKGTLVKLLLAHHPDLSLSVSATTRPPREGETEGKDYFFLSRDQFENMIETGELLEWAEYAGNYYGTPRQGVEEKLQAEEWVVLEIEVVGARKIKQSFPEATRVFILPPSLAVLEERLIKRGKDSKAAIAQRLEHAETEIAAAEEFEFCVVNDDLDRSLVKLEKIIFQPSQKD
ncbi:guanylate kinase [Euhalothece natronophila Z-M001]|uniref:Guanylate kinase n=1 Tax=Euhalothece natronophila Z-M001 TaxID=522448 RepID=A0A5B8NMN3_9CHRO|nr:guanylate kinase [Euhalothece natronophila]QDZ39540.1 guanylate kinase [Euhalothece natronophila Z-M001]